MEQKAYKPEQIATKELKSHKDLKRKKSIGPVDKPNATFVKAKKQMKIFRDALNRIHEKEEVMKSWQIRHIFRLYKEMGMKDKWSNERGITLASNPNTENISRDKRQRIRRNEKESNMTIYRSNRNSNLHIQIRNLEPKRKRKKFNYRRYSIQHRKWLWTYHREPQQQNSRKEED